MDLFPVLVTIFLDSVTSPQGQESACYDHILDADISPLPFSMFSIHGHKIQYSAAKNTGFTLFTRYSVQ
jgi:hypothetical protein